MEVITNLKQLSLSPISDEVKRSIGNYFRFIVKEQLGVDKYQQYDIGEHGRIIVLTDSDVRGGKLELTDIVELVGEAFRLPEFIDVLKIDGLIYYRITAIESSSCGIVVYIPKELVSSALCQWIKEMEA